MLDTKEGQTVNLKLALVLRPLTLDDFDRPSSKPLKLHVKYLENGDRYDDGVNGMEVEYETTHGLDDVEPS